MAIQSAVNAMLGTGAAATVAVKKGAEGQKQEAEKAAAEKAAKAEKAAAEKAAKAEQGLRNEAEAKESALQADLVRMGADPESAESYILARRMGLDGKGFGMIRKKGRFVGSYSSLAEKLSKDAITDSLSARLLMIDRRSSDSIDPVSRLSFSKYTETPRSRSVLTSSRQSVVFLAKRLRDFVTMRSILPSSQSRSIC